MFVYSCCAKERNWSACSTAYRNAKIVKLQNNKSHTSINNTVNYRPIIVRRHSKRLCTRSRWRLTSDAGFSIGSRPTSTNNINVTAALIQRLTPSPNNTKMPVVLSLCCQSTLISTLLHSPTSTPSYGCRRASSHQHFTSRLNNNWFSIIVTYFASPIVISIFQDYCCGRVCLQVRMNNVSLRSRKKATITPINYKGSDETRRTTTARKAANALARGRDSIAAIIRKSQPRAFVYFLFLCLYLSHLLNATKTSIVVHNVVERIQCCIWRIQCCICAVRETDQDRGSANGARWRNSSPAGARLRRSMFADATGAHWRRNRLRCRVETKSHRRATAGTGSAPPTTIHPHLQQTVDDDSNKTTTKSNNFQQYSNHHTIVYTYYYYYYYCYCYCYLYCYRCFCIYNRWQTCNGEFIACNIL